MRIDPALRALRSDPAPQRSAQTALERVKSDWLCSEKNTEIFGDLARFGAGDELIECPALKGLVSVPESAIGFVGALVDMMLLQLGHHPLGQVPFRHQYSGKMAVLQLAAAGDAAISLVMYERSATAADPQTICFTDSERHEIVIAGSGKMTIVKRIAGTGQPSDLGTQPIHLGEGQHLSLRGMFETKFVSEVQDRLVVLRLSRTELAPEPSLEFRLRDGALVHRASGDKRDSRQEMILALLGNMGRKDAAPVMAEMASEGSDHLRWQALRECLALDTAAGFAALCAIARDPGDTLSPNAAALRAQLIEAHPQLAVWEDGLCPA